jgi:anti-sigma B factor antagonist
MQITTQSRGDIAVVELVGDLDSRSCATTEQAVLGQLGGARRLVLNLTGVPYTSSAGLRTLLLIYRHVSENGIALALAGLVPGVRDVLAATGFLAYFLVCDTVEEAIRLLDTGQERAG